MQSEQELRGFAPAAQEQAEPLVSYSVRPRRLGMRIVSYQELKGIGSASAEASLFLTLLGLAFGALITIAATLGTVDIQNPFTYATFWAVLIVSGLATICFGALGLNAWSKYKQQIRTIEEESATREPTAA